MMTNDHSPERTRRKYTAIVYGFYVVGIAGLLLGMVLDYELVGSVVYLLGIVGGAGSGALLQRRTSVTISDERDERLARRASHRAIVIAAAVGLAVFPVLFVLDAAGQYTFTPVVEGVLYAFSALGLLWGACYLAVKYVL